MHHTEIEGLTALASIFAALGDETRLAMLTTLCEGAPRSIARLTEGTELSRQAVSKHLQVLATAGIVRRVRVGRESLFAPESRALVEAQTYLDQASRRWDDALARLKAHVESQD